MSSGLVATMGLPANAATAGAEAAAPATAPIAVQPGMALQSGLLSAVGATDSSASELTAPAAAAVSFESGAFKAVPKAQGASFDLGGFGSAKGSSIVAIASRYLGVKYVYGGTTPNGWDCSGFTGYVYRLAGINLPRTANEQLMASHRISREQAVPGDLVFFVSGGRAGHVGIYVGDNMMIDAGSTGKVTSKREIYSSSVIFGRF